jgi:hypothetical protein
MAYDTLPADFGEAIRELRAEVELLHEDHRSAARALAATIRRSRQLRGEPVRRKGSPPPAEAQSERQ